MIWRDRLKVVLCSMRYREAWAFKPRQSWGLLKYLLQTRPIWGKDTAELNAYSPPVGGEAYSRYLSALRKIGRREWTPLVVHLSVTDRCPYHCSRCSNLSRASRDPSLFQLQRVIEQLRTAGTVRVAITGGEPLLRDDLPQIVAACAPDLSPLLFTSGHGLDANAAQLLCRAGLSAAFVSLDHFRKEVHDDIRGVCGAFDKTLDAIHACLDAGIPTTAQAVVGPDLLNDDGLQRYLDFCVQLGVQEVMLLEPVAVGMNPEMNGIGEEERRRLADLHLRSTSDSSLPKVSCMSWLESPECLGCQAGFTFLHITSQGEVYPCDFVPASFGNVFESGLPEIHHRMMQALKQPSRACLALELRKRYGNHVPPLAWEQTKTVFEDYEPGRLPSQLQYLCHE